MLVAAVLMVAAPAAAAVPDRPGTYHVYSCALPSGAPTGTQGWRSFGDQRLVLAGVRFGDECASGRGLSIFTGARAQEHGAEANWEFAPPAGTVVDRMSIWRSANLGNRPLGPSPIWANYVKTRGVTVWQSSLGMVSELVGVPYLEGFRDPRDPLDPSSLVAFEGDVPGSEPEPGERYSTNVTVGLSCHGDRDPATPRGGLCLAGPQSSSLIIWASDALLRDERPPAVEKVRPSVELEGRPTLTGPLGLLVDATDDGAGLASVRLFVDGRPQPPTEFEAPVTCRPLAAPDGRPAFTVPSPCPTAGTGRIGWDPSTVEEGLHALRAEVEDAAGNVVEAGAWTVRVARPPQTVTSARPASQPAVDRGAPNGSVDTDEATLTASLLDDGLQVSNLTWDLPWTKAAKGTPLEGTLTAGGRPVAGAVLDLVGTSTAYGSDPVVIGRVTTARTGAFSTTIPVSAGSSTVAVRWRSHLRDSAAAAEATVFLRVVGDLTIKATPTVLRRGGRVRLTGTLRGRGGSVANVPVLVQGRGSSGGWATVLSGETDALGRWRATKALQFSRGRVQFRVRTQFSLAYPYEPSGWHGVSVRVR